MKQTGEIQLSIEDDRIIENCQLGAPLAIYRQKQSHIKLYYQIGLFFLLMSIGSFILLIIGSFKVWHETALGAQSSASEYFQFLFSLYLFTGDAFSGLIVCLAAQVIAWFLLLIIYPQAKSAHIIICEEGLVAFSWKIKRNSVQALRWTNIREITGSPTDPDYSIHPFENTGSKFLHLSSDYKDLNELIAQIRQKMDESGRP